MSALIEAHCDGLRYSDQLPTFDPPKHTRHRGPLLRLLTPRRLQDNEASMWRLADAVMDEFTGEGRCEFVADFAGPFAMLVIADLLGVPEEDHDLFRRGTGQVKGGFGSTNGEQLAHTPLEFLYQAFTAYIEDRRRSLRGDVLSRLAAATYKDGSTPAVIDVARLAANLFAALTTSTGSGRSRTPTTGPPTSPFSPPGHRRATGSARSGESPRSATSSTSSSKRAWLPATRPTPRTRRRSTSSTTPATSAASTSTSPRQARAFLDPALAVGPVAGGHARAATSRLAISARTRPSMSSRTPRTTSRD